VTDADFLYVRSYYSSITSRGKGLSFGSETYPCDRGRLSGRNLHNRLASAATGAWATWALARRATGSSLAAFVAGIVYGWSPYHQARIVAGHLNLASYQWLPLYVLALLRTIDALWPGGRAEGWHAGPAARETRLPARWRAFRWATVAGVAAGATATTELTYAAFLALWTIFYLAYRAWPLWRARAWRMLVVALGPLALAGGLALLLAAPLLLAMRGEIRRDTSGYMVSRPLETLTYSADTLQYVLPNELHPWASPALRAYVDRISGTPNVAERIVAPGWTVLALSTLALVLARRRRAVRFWGWTLLLSAILGVGPIFHWAGQVFFTPFNASVLFPYALLYAVPGFAIMRAPLRFAVLVSLAGALLVASALAEVRARWPRLAPALLALSAALIVTEDGWRRALLCCRRRSSRAPSDADSRPEVPYATRRLRQPGWRPGVRRPALALGPPAPQPPPHVGGR